MEVEMVRKTKELRENINPSGSIENPRGDPVEQQSIPAPNWPIQTLTKKKLVFKLPKAGLSKTKAKILGLIFMVSIAAILTAVGMSIAFPPNKPEGAGAKIATTRALTQNGIVVAKSGEKLWAKQSTDKTMIDLFVDNKWITVPKEIVQQTKQVEQVKTIPTPANQVAKVVATKKPIVVATEKAPVIGTLKALDVVNASWLSIVQLMLITCTLGIVVSSFLDAKQGGNKELREFVFTFVLILIILFADIIISPFKPSPDSRRWIALCIVITCVALETIFSDRGGITPIASFLILLGVIGALFGSIGELGIALGIKSGPLLPGYQVAVLIVAKKYSLVIYSLINYLLILVGLILSAKESGLIGTGISSISVLIGVVIRIVTFNSVSELWIPWVYLLGIEMLALGLSAGFVKYVPPQRATADSRSRSKRTIFDTVITSLVLVIVIILMTGRV